MNWSMAADEFKLYAFCHHRLKLGLPYVRNFPDMSGIPVLKFATRNNLKNALMSGILTVSEEHFITSYDKYE